MKDKEPDKIEFERGCGNVFADLGLDDADERLARAKLGFHVYKILTDRELGESEIASLLGIRPARRVAPLEWPFQPVHHGQATRFPQATRPEGLHPDHAAPAGGTLSGGRLRTLIVGDFHFSAKEAEKQG